MVIKNLISKDDTLITFPFFIFDNPFKKFLIKLSNSDGKMYSLFKRVGIGEELGIEIVNELIENNILYLVNSRERSIKTYPKQKIKKEYKNYLIEPKLYFTKPFYRFWFAFVEPYRDNKDFKKLVIESFNKWGYKLNSLVFEQLSIEVLKKDYEKRDKIIEYGAYWDIESEFDIYCKTVSGKVILGECKYKNKPITYNEFLKLQAKAKRSNLKIDYYALFSKNGFTQEFYKNKDNNLMLYDLKSLEIII